MWTALPPSDYYADSATPRAHQPASGLAGPPPAARRARGASHVHHDPFDRVGSRLYPYSTSDEHSQSPAGHHARIDEPGVERAAVNQGGIVAVDDPCPPGLGSFLQSRGFYHQFACALPFGLASTHAGVWQYRPAVTFVGTLHPTARDPAPEVAPSFAGPLHQPGAGIPADTDEMLLSVRQGRAGARCRRYRRSGSPTRPPNRTCPFPGIRLSAGHVMAGLDAVVMQRRFPVEWWLGLFGCPPTARGCCGRDSDIGSLRPHRASEASCLRGWSSGAPSTVA